MESPKMILDYSYKWWQHFLLYVLLLCFHFYAVTQFIGWYFTTQYHNISLSIISMYQREQSGSKHNILPLQTATFSVQIMRTVQIKLSETMSLFFGGVSINNPWQQHPMEWLNTFWYCHVWEKWKYPIKHSIVQCRCAQLSSTSTMYTMSSGRGFPYDIIPTRISPPQKEAPWSWSKKAREGTPNRFRLVHLLHNVYHHPK